MNISKVKYNIDESLVSEFIFSPNYNKHVFESEDYYLNFHIDKLRSYFIFLLVQYVIDEHFAHIFYAYPTSLIMSGQIADKLQKKLDKKYTEKDDIILFVGKHVLQKSLI